MKKIIDFLVIAIILIVFAAIFFNFVRPYIYRFAYEDMVERTVRKIIDEKILKSCIMSEDGDRSFKVIHRDLD
jgi:hypothetical protein